MGEDSFLNPICDAGVTMEDRWLSMEEICKYLGVSNDTIHRWITRNDMPSTRFGRCWKFKKARVDAWAEAGGAETKTFPARKVNRK